MDNINFHNQIQSLERHAKPRREFVRYLRNRLQLQSPRSRWYWILPIVVTPLVVAAVFIVTWPKPQPAVGFDRDTLIQALDQLQFADQNHIVRYDFRTVTDNNHHDNNTIWYFDENSRIDHDAMGKTGHQEHTSQLYSKLDQLACSYNKHKVDCEKLVTAKRLYDNGDPRQSLFHTPTAAIPYQIKVEQLIDHGTAPIMSASIKLHWETDQPIDIGRVLIHDQPFDLQSYLVRVRLSSDYLKLNKPVDDVYRHVAQRQITLVNTEEFYFQIILDDQYSDIIKYNVRTQTATIADPYSLPLLQDEINQFDISESPLQRYLQLPLFLAKHFKEIPEEFLTVTEAHYHDQAATGITVPHSALQEIDAGDLLLDPFFVQTDRAIRFWLSDDGALLGYELLESDGHVYEDTRVTRTELNEDPEQWFRVANWKQAIGAE